MNIIWGGGGTEILKKKAKKKYVNLERRNNE